jgi:hypothetical protein
MIYTLIPLSTFCHLCNRSPELDGLNVVGKLASGLAAGVIQTVVSISLFILSSLVNIGLTPFAVFSESARDWQIKMGVLSGVHGGMMSSALPLSIRMAYDPRLAEIFDEFFQLIEYISTFPTFLNRCSQTFDFAFSGVRDLMTLTRTYRATQINGV